MPWLTLDVWAGASHTPTQRQARCLVCCVWGQMSTHVPLFKKWFVFHGVLLNVSQRFYLVCNAILSKEKLRSEVISRSVSSSQPPGLRFFLTVWPARHPRRRGACQCRPGCIPSTGAAKGDKDVSPAAQSMPLAVTWWGPRTWWACVRPGLAAVTTNASFTPVNLIFIFTFVLIFKSYIYPYLVFRRVP